LQNFNPENNNNGRESWVKSINPFFYVVFVLGIIFFLYQILGGFLTVIAGGDDPDSNVNIMRIILTFGQFMFIFAPTLFFARLQSSDLKNTFRLNVPKVHLILLAIMGILLIQPFLQGYSYFQDYILNHLPFFQNTIRNLKDFFDKLENTSLKIVSAYSTIEFIVVVFVICLTPAICEEMLFRGFVFSNILKVARLPVGIFMTSFLFAIYHFEPFNVIPLAILGAFIAYVVYYSNSIYIGMMCHFLNNFFASFYFYKYGKQDFETPHLTNSEMMNTAAAAIISALLFFLVMYIFYKFRERAESGNNYE